MPGFQIVFLILVACLLLGALARWRRTPEAHPDYDARGDMARLLAVVLLGQVGALARSRFPDRSPGFLALSLALLPVAGAALFFIWRLFLAYRRESDG